MEFAKPRAATKADIAGVINRFAHAAEYLDKVGFDGIQFHGAHGYLIAQFLSNTTNKRTDEYGGSLENRMRFIIEIVTECQKRVKPSFIFGIKINSVEFQEGGFSPEEARALCQALELDRFDYVELSGGTYESFAFENSGNRLRRGRHSFLSLPMKL
jgi:2,4-dienoyl-CoA reductase-like NADH-dependent reductase (Old Yellow Enzyme family)